MSGYRATIILDVYAHGCFRATVYEGSIRSEYALRFHGVRGACPAEAAS